MYGMLHFGRVAVRVTPDHLSPGPTFSSSDGVGVSSAKLATVCGSGTKPL
jgi:hypothetical protein